MPDKLNTYIYVHEGARHFFSFFAALFRQYIGNKVAPVAQERGPRPVL